MGVYCSIILLQISLIGAIDTSNSGIQFVAANDCTCRGYNVTYECTVFGSGATAWMGTAIDCSFTDDEFVIFQTLQTTHTCNNGAIAVRIVRADNDSYTSQLNVYISNDAENNATVVCAYDNGIESIEIGSTILNITTAPFPPPTDIQLVEEDLTHLSFNWTHVSLSCQSIQYHIVASNCGECPTTTSNNTVTCNGNYTQQMSDHQCSFAVRTVVCDDLVGDVSIAVTVSTTAEGSDPKNSTMADSKEKDLYADSGMIIRLIIPIIVVLVVVLMGITLVLGLTLVYLIIKRAKNTENQRSASGRANLFGGAADNNEQVHALGIGVYSYLQSTEDQDQNPTSGTIDDIMYADLGPNTAARVAHLTLLHDDCVQYEEIQHEAVAEAPVCGPQTSGQILVNLDLLLILLKEELTPRWYEFGLVIGVPKDIMDSYLGYPSDQCLIELLDYWLRHHIGHLTWKEVAQALRELKLYQMAEKVLQISATGKFPLEADINNNTESKKNANELPPALPHKRNLGVATTITAPEYEDTAGLLHPPPLPPKSKNT